MIRLGLCCIFKKEKIHFRSTTAKYLLSLKEKRFLHLSHLILSNCQSLFDALVFCHKKRIGCFRITSKFFPSFTHPKVGYKLEDLPYAEKIFAQLQACKKYAQKKQIRLTLHPDQFVILSAKDPQIIRNSINELEYHSYLAELVGADVITIHGGGKYESKKKALQRIKNNFRKLSKKTKMRLALENDEKSYTPQDLIPLCHSLKIPFIYDIHHHRCKKDLLDEKKATQEAIKTWNREPLFHLSSPLHGWKKSDKTKHSDCIRFSDFPIFWQEIPLVTVEIEAKAKELAVLRLMDNLQKKQIALFP